MRLKVEIIFVKAVVFNFPKKKKKKKLSHFLRHVLLLEFQWWESKNKIKEMFLTVIFVSFVRRESILVLANCSACQLKITVSVSANLSCF